jgi:hypothetical protein
MNKFIKLICLSIALIAPAHAMQAMQNDAVLGRQLLTAAKVGDHKELERLIKAGVPVDYMDSWEMTALQFAAFEGHLDCIRILIAGGALVNHQDIHGETALLCATTYKRLPCIKALLAAGARVDLANTCDWTPLTFAIFNKGHQPVYELFINAMLLIPNKDQKKRMITFLGITKLRKNLYPSGLYAYLRNELKRTCPAAVYDNNKNNFESSIAYQKLMRIKVLPLMEGPESQKRIAALLEKYNPGGNNSESQSWCSVQ